jgi:protein tyrosine/serine phosphatase
MAKLPYTITICPDQPNPKQYTALSPALVRALMYSSDLTIDQRQYAYPSAPQGITQINTHKEKNSEQGRKTENL